MLDRIICLIILPTVVAGIALAVFPTEQWVHTDLQRIVVSAVMFASGSVGGWHGLRIIKAKKGGQ